MSTLELYRSVFHVDEMAAEVDRLTAENARLVAEVERLKALASRPVSWASPAGPAAPRHGRPDAPSGVDPEADGAEATP